jgi:thioredoxin-like negative regulator of GroEL
MAVALVQQGKPVEASEVFLQLIKLQSGHIEAHTQLAKIYCDLNKPEEAIKIYQDLSEMYRYQGKVALTKEIDQKIAAIQTTIEVAHQQLAHQQDILAQADLIHIGPPLIGGPEMGEHLVEHL